MSEDHVAKDEFFSFRYAQMVGFIFAVVVARSFENYSGILFRPWSDWLAFVALVCLYVFVILSWAGYQNSLKGYPYKETKLSTLRVMSDFLIVVVYVFMLNSIRQIHSNELALNYILGFVFTFIAYLISGKLRQIEYTNKASKQNYLYYSLIALLAIFGVYYYLKFHTGLQNPMFEWGAVILPIGVTITWRYRRDIGGIINS